MSSTKPDAVQVDVDTIAKVSSRPGKSVIFLAALSGVMTIALVTSVLVLADRGDCPVPGPFPTTGNAVHAPSPPPLPRLNLSPDMASSATTQGCTTAIIGAGAGGLYTAYRMVVDALVPASSICIFEASGRIGGRILSVRNLGPLGDMVLDAGGYRTFDSISPRTQYLIETRLGLKVGG